MNATTLRLLAIVFSTALAVGQGATDFHVTANDTWQNTTYTGNIIIHSQVTLTLTGLTTINGNVTVLSGGRLHILGSAELVLNCVSDRDYALYINAGGTVNCYGAAGGVSPPRAAISGSAANSASTVVYVDGTLDMWHATMNYHYGLHLSPTGIFQGIDLVQGTWCGELLHGGGWARLERSDFAVSLEIDSRAGVAPTASGFWNLSFPTGSGITQTISTASGFPPLRVGPTGATVLSTTLILVNTTIPWWHLFINMLNPANPPMGLEFDGDSLVNVAFLGSLGSKTQQYTINSLPSRTTGTDWFSQQTSSTWVPTPSGPPFPTWTVGNVTAVAVNPSNKIPWHGYGFYLAPGSNLLLRTPSHESDPSLTRGTTIFEIMLNYLAPSNAESCRMELDGTYAYALNATATTFEVGPNAALKLTNSRVGLPSVSAQGIPTTGQRGRITKHATRSTVEFENCVFFDVELHNWTTFGHPLTLPPTCIPFSSSQGFTFVN